MNLINFTSVLLTLFSLAINVSATCRSSTVNTAKTCTTVFGQYPPYGEIPKYTKVITTKTSITITYTKEAKTKTVTAPDVTYTDYVTTTETKTGEYVTETDYATAYETTTITYYKVKTDYTKVTVATVTTYKPKCPKPYEPKPYEPAPPYGGYDKRDDYYVPPKYPVAISCTKTLATTYTCSKTVTPPKVTYTAPGETVTVTYTVTDYTTIYPTTTTTITITDVQTTSTKVKTTTTVTIPVTKTVCATPTKPPCGPHNIRYNVEVNIFKWDPSYPTKNAYECCEACWKHRNYAGVQDCVGSFFTYDKKSSYSKTKPSKGKCWLKLSDKCEKPKKEKYNDYKKKSKWDEYEGAVSNGPCGWWSKY